MSHPSSFDSTLYLPGLRWIDQQRDVMLQQVMTWSGINSGSYHTAGVNRMANALVDAFAPLGGTVERLPVAPLAEVDAKGNLQYQPMADVLRIRKRPDAPVRVLLAGHMDTVFPQDSSFQTPSIKDTHTLHGPGVADLKGGLSVMLTALTAWEQQPHADQLGWEVFLNPDEEIGSIGSSAYMPETAARNHVGLIYEPALADGTLAGARKGSGNFVLLVRGRAAHAGRDHHLGRNALVLLAEATLAINALNGQQAGVTVNPGKAEGGGPVNVVPDLGILRFNVRTATHAEQHWVEQQLHNILHNLRDREGFSLELHGGFTRPPKPMDAKQQKLFALVKACGDDLGLEMRWQATGGCCDGNNFHALGLPNVDTLGVRGGHIHSHDEFMLIDSLTERAKLSFLLLSRLAADPSFALHRES